MAPLALALVLGVSASAYAADRQAVGEDTLPLPDDPRAWSEKVAPGLLAEALEQGGQLDCMVTFREPPAVARVTATGVGGQPRRAWISRTGADIDRDFAPAGARVLSRYTFLPVLRMSVPAASLPALAGDPRVEGVTPILKAHAFRTEGKALMNVAAVHAQGFTGTGVGIAIFDTGVDYTHPELSPEGVKTIKLLDAINNDGDPMDDDGHGTACAGIAAGAGGGVAPGATIVAVKVLDENGDGNSDQIMAGIDAVLASINGGNPYNIRVASMSFGGYIAVQWPPKPGNCDSLTPDFVQAFGALASAGVLTVIAAGNGACTNGVAWPACVSGVLAVGAVYDATLGFRSYTSLQCGSTCSDFSTSADQVTCYTDSGDKLDVWAPADCATTPRLGGGNESCFNGTSAATPYAAGVAALLAQAVPGVATADLRVAIRDTGSDVTDPRNSLTRKRVNAQAALASLGGACDPPPAPAGLAADRTTACTGQSIALSWGAVAGAASYTVQAATNDVFTGQQEFAAPGPAFAYAPSLATPAILYFRVRAKAECGDSSGPSPVVQVSFNPTCGSPYGKVYHVSGIGHLHGVAPAFWYSDLAAFNPGESAAALRVSFYGAAVTPDPVTAALAGHQQLAWPDVLTTLFGLTGEDVGAITVESTQPLQVTARTYSRITDACDGKQKTYGQSYDGIEPADSLAAGQLGYLINLRSDGGFRTNVEFVNVGSLAANVEVRFFNGGGSQIGSPLNRGLTPNQRVGVTSALPAGQSAAYAEVRVTPALARVIGFASVIDGNSTDPTTIPMLVTGTPSS